MYEYESHSSRRGESEHDVVTLGVLLELEVLAELEAGVDHGSDAEGDRAHSQVKATVVLSRKCPGHVRTSGRRRVPARRRLRGVQIAHVFLLFGYKFIVKLVYGNKRILRFIYKM